MNWTVISGARVRLFTQYPDYLYQRLHMSWAQRQLTMRIQILSVKFRKNNVRRSWDALLTTDTVIACVNTLGGDQPGKLTFTYQKVRLIGYVQIPGVPPEAPTTLEPDNVDIDIPGMELEDNAELPGVDGDDNETTQIVGIIDDLDVPSQDPPPI